MLFSIRQDHKQIDINKCGHVPVTILSSSQISSFYLQIYIYISLQSTILNDLKTVYNLQLFCLFSVQSTIRFQKNKRMDLFNAHLTPTSQAERWTNKQKSKIPQAGGGGLPPSVKIINFDNKIVRENPLNPSNW